VKKLRLGLIAAGAVALPLLATTAMAATSGATAAAAGPTAAQLLAKTATCTPASTGKYATDEGGAATINICKSGSAYHWTSDLDIDCDGISTTRCNATTDPSYWHETSFQTSTGQFFTADVTHYFVIPLPSSRFNYGNAGIKPGNVGAVIYNNTAGALNGTLGDIAAEGAASLASERQCTSSCPPASRNSSHICARLARASSRSCANPAT